MAGMAKICGKIRDITAWLIPWVIFLAFSGAIFFQSYYKYKYCPQYFYLHSMLGESLGWSRGSAAVLWVSCSAVLLPMCRNLLTFLRSWLYKFPIQSLKRFLDENVEFHKICAFITITASVIHTIAHLINAEHFSKRYNQEYGDLNFAKYKNENPLVFVLFSVAGSTGILMMMILIVMIGTSMPLIRRSSYELFWYTHHLCFVFYILLAVHGLGGVVKRQINLGRHPPGCTMYRDVNITNNANACVEPSKFEADEAQAWKFLVVPVCLYFLDRMVRVIRNCQEVDIIKVVKHSCEVVELRMNLTGFQARPGQYIYIRCRDIALFEWHPFTLTKCPTRESQVFAVHFKISGDWTTKFAEKLSKVGDTTLPLPVSSSSDKTCVIGVPSHLRINLDGPYGSPCMDICQYEVSLCIASGIGVTPFAAVINSYRVQETLSSNCTKLRRLYFVWVSRDAMSFGWFTEVLYSKHLQLWNTNRPDFLVCCFYSTKRHPQQPYKSCANKGCIGSWLRARLTQGRPDWPAIFRRVGSENPRSTIGVFYCGTKNISSKLRNLCRRPNKTHSTFVFHNETL